MITWPGYWPLIGDGDSFWNMTAIINRVIKIIFEQHRKIFSVLSCSHQHSDEWTVVMVTAADGRVVVETFTEMNAVWKMTQCTLSQPHRGLRGLLNCAQFCKGIYSVVTEIWKLTEELYWYLPDISWPPPSALDSESPSAGRTFSLYAAGSLARSCFLLIHRVFLKMNTKRSIFCHLILYLTSWQSRDKDIQNWFNEFISRGLRSI